MITTMKISSRGGDTHGKARIAVGRLTETCKININPSGICHGFNRDLGLSWISGKKREREKGGRGKDARDKLIIFLYTRLYVRTEVGVRTILTGNLVLVCKIGPEDQRK